MKIHQSLASPLNGAIVGEISFSYVLFILQKFTGIRVFILSLAKSDKLEQGIDFFSFRGTDSNLRDAQQTTAGVP